MSGLVRALLGVCGVFLLFGWCWADAPGVRGTALAGAYVIGPAPSDYTDVQDALDDIMSDGISAPVRLRFKAGTHTVHASLSSFNRQGNSNDILNIESLDPGNPAVLQHAATSDLDNWLLKLDGVTFVRVRDLTFEATGVAAFSALVLLENGTSNSRIVNNTFENYASGPATPPALVSSIVSPTPSVMQDVLIEGNTFVSGNGAIHIQSSSSDTFTGLTIKDNVFIDQFAQGQSRVLSLVATHDAKIIGNLFDNSISGAKGITLAGNTETRIEGNQILMLGGGNGGFGISALNLNNGVGGTTDIFNNIIVASENVIAVENSSRDVRIRHNTLVSKGTVGALTATVLEFNLLSNDANIEILNNIARSEMTHSEARIFLTDNLAAIAESNHNAFEGNNTEKFAIEGIDYNDLKAYQNATGLDAMSNEVVVDFADALTGDYHLAVSQYGDPVLIVTPPADIVFDVDGETRHPLNSMIGADDADAEVIFVNSYE